MLLLFVFIIIAVIVVGGDVVAIFLLQFLNFHANVENDLFVVIAVAVAVAVDDNDVVDEIVDKAKFENRLDSKPTHLLLLEGFIIFCEGAVVSTRLRYSLSVVQVVFMFDVIVLFAFASSCFLCCAVVQFHVCCLVCRMQVVERLAADFACEK